jgi:hypothetical protein
MARQALRKAPPISADKLVLTGRKPDGSCLFTSPGGGLHGSCIGHTLHPLSNRYNPE